MNFPAKPTDTAIDKYLDGFLAPLKGETVLLEITNEAINVSPSGYSYHYSKTVEVVRRPKRGGRDAS